MSGESLWSESEGPCTHHDVLTLNHVASHEVDYKVDSNTQSRWVFLQPNNKEPRSTLDTFYIRACATSGRTFAPRSRHNVQHSWPFSISWFTTSVPQHLYPVPSDKPLPTALLTTWSSSALRSSPYRVTVCLSVQYKHGIWVAPL